MAHRERDHGRKEPLFRRVNNATHGIRIRAGGEFRHERRSGNDWESTRGSMHSGRDRGLDYTPLYCFLLARVGRRWEEIHSEAVGRLDREEPIWWMVAAPGAERRTIFRSDENSYFSGLFVDDEGILRAVDPQVRLEDEIDICSCCTHTFNGERVAPPPRDLE